MKTHNNMKISNAPGALMLVLSLLLSQTLLTASSPDFTWYVSNINQAGQATNASEQRCNFKNDLANGEDERACGACLFEGSDPRQECGLELWADESLHWSWFELPADVFAQVTRQGVAVKGTLKLGVTGTAHEMTSGSGSSGNPGGVATPTRRAGVYFPSYRPTDSKNCKFAYAHRPAFIGEGAHNQPAAIIKTVLVTASRKYNRTQANEELAELQLLDSFMLEQSSKYARQQKERLIVINSTLVVRSTWTIAMLIETKLTGPSPASEHLLLELADFRFLGCEPSSAFLNDHKRREKVVELARVAQHKCPDARDNNSFICKLSARCLGEESRCDFGHDCGPFDFSDEQNCARDSYEGRCDFEHGPELCNWSASPVRGDSWLWTGQAANGTANSVNRITSRGHFMLANTKYGLARPYTRLELHGPRVHLRPGHSQCHFRFWASTSITFTGQYLGDEMMQVYRGDKFVQAIKIIDLRESEKAHTWRRYQVLLINASEVNLIASLGPGRLRLSYGLATNAKSIITNDAFLALDDFSFSPGCQLAHHEQSALASLCRPGQFTCAHPAAHAPEQVCLPASRVCDFKDDCGRDAATGPASDELLCRRAFDFARDNLDLTTSGVHLNNYERCTSADAFRLELPVTSNAGLQRPLTIVAQSDVFREAMLSGCAEAQVREYASESGVLLPRFNQAHANCLLRLYFAWAKPKNLTLNIYLIRGSTQRLLLRHQTQHNEAFPYRQEMPAGQPTRAWGQATQSIELGIGQQDNPFNVHVELSFGGRFRGDGRHDDLRDSAYSGDFRLWAYEFAGCDFPAGRVAPAPRLEMHNLEDLAETNAEEYQYQYSAQKSSSGNLTCPVGHFQCKQPILCLPERLMCDMQRDCQESNADELDCPARGHFQLNFESDLEINPHSLFIKQQPELVVSHSLTEEGAASTPKDGWQTRSAWGLGLRHEHAVGPAVDHTRRSPLGRFLTLAYQGGNEYAYADKTVEARFQATLTLGRFRVATSCKRLVVYAHIWPEPPSRQAHERDQDNDHDHDYDQEGLTQLEHSLEWDICVHYHHHRSHLDLQLDDVFVYSKQLNWWQDGWRRIELELPHTNTNLCANCSQADQFSISFRGTVTTWPGMQRPVLAFDDLVLGPKCELAGLVTAATPTTTSANRTRTNAVVRLPILEPVSADEAKLVARHEIGLHAHQHSQSSMVADWFAGLFAFGCGVLVVLAMTNRGKLSKKMAIVKYWRSLA